MAQPQDRPKGAARRVVRPRQIREAAGVSQVHVAAWANISLPTVRLFEADPMAVSPESRRGLEPVYAELAKRVSVGAAR
jgi:hypothetical protein